MSFYFDSTGIETGKKEFTLLPEKQWFPFKIVDTEELKSASGRDMVKCVCEVVEDPKYAGTSVWHYVVFIPKGEKGEGISVHFRKCIGQPYGGNDLVDANAWRGARFMGKIVHEPYKDKINHKIGEVSPYTMDGAKPNADDQIPF